MGKLIVIEGTDGSGKSTQFQLMTERLQQEGVSFKRMVFPRYKEESSALIRMYLSFPRYKEESSALIRMYLSGQFGTRPSDVNAYAASSFYAVDRYASYKMDWGQWYEDGGVVVCDRYTTSNAVHQASKQEGQARKDFLKWLYDFEYGQLGLPQPDLVIYLDVPTDFTQKMLRGREAATHTTADIHEKDMAYLATCRRCGREAAAFYNWKIIECVKDGEMRSIEDIHNDIYTAVKQCLEG